jgi:hypothetical protein
VVVPRRSAGVRGGFPSVDGLVFPEFGCPIDHVDAVIGTDLDDPPLQSHLDWTDSTPTARQPGRETPMRRVTSGPVHDAGLRYTDVREPPRHGGLD